MPRALTWSILPAEISSHILSYAWSISEKSSQWYYKRDPHPKTLSQISTQWGHEVRRHTFKTLKIETLEDVQWILQYIESVADGTFPWEFAPLVQHLDVGWQVWHIPDMHHYAAQLRTLLQRLPRLSTLTIRRIKTSFTELPHFLSASLSLQYLAEVTLCGSCEEKEDVDMRPLLDTLARMPYLKALCLDLSTEHMAGSYVLDTPVPLPHLEKLGINREIYIKDVGERLRQSVPSLHGARPEHIRDSKERTVFRLLNAAEAYKFYGIIWLTCS